MRRLCCSRAPQTVPQRVPLDRASVTRCSAAWSMAPAGYNLLPLQRRARGTKQQNSQAETTNKRIKGQTNPQPKKGRGRKSKWRECVCCWGRQSSAILSHLRKLTGGEAYKNKTQNRESRKRQPTQRSTKQTQEKAKPTRTGEANNTKQDRRQRGGQNQPTRRGAQGGRRQAVASRRGKRGRPGRQQGQEGENRTGQEGGHVQL